MSLRPIDLRGCVACLVIKLGIIFVMVSLQRDPLGSGRASVECGEGYVYDVGKYGCCACKHCSRVSIPAASVRVQYSPEFHFFSVWVKLKIEPFGTSFK